MSKLLHGVFEFLCFSLCLCLAIILALNGEYSSVFLDGLKLWVACVIPALFPYLFITAILSNLNLTYKIAKRLSPLTERGFNTGGNVGYVFLLSVISGYPVGAKMISQLKKENMISMVEAERGSAFCSTSSPMFLIGSVGNLMFFNSLFGTLLFLSSLLSSITVGVIFSFYKRKEKPQPFTLPKQKTEDFFSNSVSNCILSILTVGSIIAVFFLLTEILNDFYILKPVSFLFTKLFNDETVGLSISTGLIECTKGLKILSNSSSPFILPVASALCGFGGLSVITQSVCFLKSAKIKVSPFISGKLLTLFINFFYGLILSLLFF